MAWPEGYEGKCPSPTFAIMVLESSVESMRKHVGGGGSSKSSD